MTGSTPYSVCESVYNPPLGKWHIRRLTSIGPKYGGGIDSKTLCGRDMQGWDLEVTIDEHHLEKTICKECARLYKKALEKNHE